MKEFFRKKIVGLKRNPSIIPMLMMVASFLLYSLNLSNVSNSTAKIQGPNMGLCGFATFLFSLLSMMCLMNSFPRRKKANIPMLVLLFIMIGIMIFCDVHYINCIVAAITREVSPIDVNSAPYLLQAKGMLQSHIVCLIISAILTATLPLYSKLIKKINTSVMVEENAGMHDIELTD